MKRMIKFCSMLSLPYHCLMGLSLAMCSARRDQRGPSRAGDLSIRKPEPSKARRRCSSREPSGAANDFMTDFCARPKFMESVADPDRRCSVSRSEQTFSWTRYGPSTVNMFFPARCTHDLKHRGRPGRPGRSRPVRDSATHTTSSSTATPPPPPHCTLSRREMIVKAAAGGRDSGDERGRERV